MHRSFRVIALPNWSPRHEADPLHSALGYLPPAEFEAQLAVQNMEAAARRQVT